MLIPMCFEYASVYITCFPIHCFYKEQFHWKYLLFKGLLEAQPKVPKESGADTLSICSVLTAAPVSSELCFWCGKTSNCSATKARGRLLFFVKEGERSRCESGVRACVRLQLKMEESHLHGWSKCCDDGSLVLTVCVPSACMALQGRCLQNIKHMRCCYRFPQ